VSTVAVTAHGRAGSAPALEAPAIEQLAVSLPPGLTYRRTLPALRALSQWLGRSVAVLDARTGVVRTVGALARQRQRSAKRSVEPPRMPISALRVAGQVSEDRGYLSRPLNPGDACLAETATKAAARPNPSHPHDLGVGGLLGASAGLLSPLERANSSWPSIFWESV
jgi:hypothetical protein